MGERRRLTAIEADQLDGARLDVSQNAEQTIEVGGFVQTVVHRLPDDGLVGDLDVADDVFLARGLGREDARQQVFGAHAL